MNPKFFADQSEFRQWLEENHQAETELLVGFYKVGSGKPSMSWSESVDQAICFGWIDGIRRSVDSESYSIRFTPRRKTSIWSAVNIKKVEELTKQNLMQPAGIAAYEHRKDHKSAIYAYENKPENLSEPLEVRFKENAAAWEFFNAQSNSYKRTLYYWVMSAKQEATQFSRLEKLIAASEAREKMR